LNNEDAIGYNNLEARAANIAQNKELAHETVFDQMLADYFLQKRGEIKKSNGLLKDLESVFGKEIGNDWGNADQEKTLGELYLRQTWDKDDTPELLPYNLPALMDLDLAVNRHLTENKGGLSEEMRSIKDQDVTIPEWFEINDPRKPADVFVKETLEGIVNELFSARRNLEKHLSRRELMAYDKVLAKYLSYD